MRREELIDAIGELPEELLAPVAALRKKKQVAWIRWASLAAACVLVLLIPLAVPGWSAESAKGTADHTMEMSREEQCPTETVTYGNLADSTAHSFRAEVLEVDGECILVSPMEGERELSSADKIYVSFREVEDVPRIEAGDTVEITYSGMLQETYPAVACGVTGIRVIE